jgi:2-C-methyl-D-erythritol 4-phosphate cytidylyltransferase / 2-C-methyl-D-erythritol 2,4-cyclodiphosphate synthase
MRSDYTLPLQLSSIHAQGLRPVSVAVVIVAAGRGTRAGGDGPKQYRKLGARTMLGVTLDGFLGHPRIGPIQTVIHPDDHALYAETISGYHNAGLLPAVDGGATRQVSVRSGLEALTAQPPQMVLIHDAARPFVDVNLVNRVIDGLATATGALPGIKVADTLKRTDIDGQVVGTQERSNLWRAQTPQGFHFNAILDAHRRAARAGHQDFTDDAAIAEWAGLDIQMVEGSERNRKLTTEEDCRMAAEEISRDMLANLPDIRTGTGFDVHRFTTGDHVYLCGVRIAHDRGLEGHSDADAPLHALTDALLGAIGDGDIGTHFPPSDMRWKGADSAIFLNEAMRKIRALGGVVANVDVTIMCEQPRIGPYRDAMRQRLAEIIGIDLARTSVKATTTERLGFTGRSEGLAAMATALVRLPLHTL